MTTHSNIVVTHNPVIEQSELEEVRFALSRISPDLTLEERTPGLQNNAEWLYPAAVAIFVASGFINGFLQEIGADSYQSLKSGLKKILKIGKEKPVLWYSMGSESEINLENITASPSLHISLEIVNLGDRERKISFIFPNDVDLNNAEKAIDLLHKTISAAIEKDNNTPDEIIAGFTMYKRVTHYAFEPESSEWKELTPNYMYQRHLQKINKLKGKEKKKSKKKDKVRKK